MLEKTNQKHHLFDLATKEQTKTEQTKTEQTKTRPSSVYKITVGENKRLPSSPLIRAAPRSE
jgi:hypothetical protein